MEFLNEQEECTGCMACTAVCPRNCIEIQENEMGFRYPIINGEKCIHCRKCEKICPIKDRIRLEHTKSYAVFNVKNVQQVICSSSGLFGELSNQILMDGGVVYGAAMTSPYQVKHIRISNPEEIDKICNSKYVQSVIEKEMYLLISEDLKSKKVLFSGTPCQVAAVRRFVETTSNLILVDVVCHGVPSPRVWRDYVKEVSNGKKPVAVSFRDKRNEECYGLCIKYENTEFYEKVVDNAYLQGFIQNLYLRQSCYACAFKGENRVADITLGDLWNAEKINKSFVGRNNGSWVLTHSSIGEELLTRMQGKFDIIEIEMDDAAKYNASYFESAECHKKREAFIENYNCTSVSQEIEMAIKENFVWQYVTKIKHFIKRIIL